MLAWYERYDERLAGRHSSLQTQPGRFYLFAEASCTVWPNRLVWQINRADNQVGLGAVVVYVAMEAKCLVGLTVINGMGVSVKMDA